MHLTKKIEKEGDFAGEFSILNDNRLDLVAFSSMGVLLGHLTIVFATCICDHAIKNCDFVFVS